MKFWKMNGAGNDFIIFNNIEEGLTVEEYCELAKDVCERHMSVGADGIMVVDRVSEKGRAAGADFKMTYINSDGTIAEMCGNGARCICRYGYENGLSGEEQVIEVSSGIVKGLRIDGNNYRIRLTDPSVLEMDYPVTVDGKMYPAAYVELGIPGMSHAVVELAGLRSMSDRELYDLGKKMRYSSIYKKGANINFFEIIGKDEIYEKTYERGVEDLTYACGTGTGSQAVVLALGGRCSDQNIRVHVRGGLLTVDINRDTTKAGTPEEIKDLFLTGPTKIVCRGELG